MERCPGGRSLLLRMVLPGGTGWWCCLTSSLHPFGFLSGHSRQAFHGSLLHCSTPAGPDCSLHYFLEKSKGYADLNRQSARIQCTLGFSAIQDEASLKEQALLSLYFMFSLILPRSCEEGPEPQPRTGELQVWRHQGCAHLLHHTCWGRHALPTFAGTCWGPFSPSTGVWITEDGRTTMWPFAALKWVPAGSLHLGKKSGGHCFWAPLLGHFFAHD